MLINASKSTPRRSAKKTVSSQVRLAWREFEIDAKEFARVLSKPKNRIGFEKPASPKLILNIVSSIIMN
jgi:hypothetical protein